MATNYMHAPEVAGIAHQLIKTVDRHSELDTVRIDFIFRSEAPRSKGRIVLGCARKISGLPAFLGFGTAPKDLFIEPEPFFVIEISHDTWQQMEPPQRKALVDHELCHCAVTRDVDAVKLSILGHDVEEFSCIIERHGLWGSGLVEMGSKVAEQLVLAVDEVTTWVENLPPTPDTDTTGETS